MINKRPKILFISHSYPPILGGVEIQNYNLAQGLKKLTDVRIIANGNGKLWLPFFIPVTLFKCFFIMSKYDVCLVGNGVLAPLAAILKILYRHKKFISVVHGLDITFSNKQGFLPLIYKLVNIPSLKYLDKLIMVGNYTLHEAVKAGIAKDQCIFIPNGVNIDMIKRHHARKELSDIFGSDVSNKKVILRLARFVPHKGTSWFIRNVMPRLDENVVMIAAGHRVRKNTAGDPDDFLNCEKIIQEKNLENRVKLLSSIPQESVEILLNNVDLVISPNINYPGSVEGFGINVIEAAICERVVIASNLQGLADAVSDGKNGFLLEPENADIWEATINELFKKNDNFIRDFGKKAREYTKENYSWEKNSQRYFDEIIKIID